ncbi:hypothetical protein TIFTF001_044757 [Ficus carica]|uniref:Uncharacterized protein n=1 Tax=Ficus carica TaxID=3494 RepID=A0AA87ZE07_FICCA|nr:hypothetical protein TIFTF001_044757 [Ficus carica]
MLVLLTELPHVTNKECLSPRKLDVSPFLAFFLALTLVDVPSPVLRHQAIDPSDPTLIPFSSPAIVCMEKLITYKMEAPQSDGDTGGVSATGTLMLKSVTVLMSKRRGRVLTRKNVHT